MADTTLSPEFEKTRVLLSTGSFKRARRHCIAALALDPENPRIIASMARIDAETGHVTYAEALSTVTELLAQHPDNARLEVAANSLRYRPTLREPGVLARMTAVTRTIYERHPDDPYVQQVLAGQLGCDKSSHPEAWELYKKAMDDGPLVTPCYKGAAHLFAKKYEPELAPLTLRGAGSLERGSILTRAIGPKPMFSLLYVAAFAAIMLRSTGNLRVSVPLMLIATMWGAWCVYANSQLCCKKCRNVWIWMVAWLILDFAVAKGIDWFVWLALMAVLMFTTWRARQDTTTSTPQGANAQ
jgi:hypothetical protein